MTPGPAALPNSGNDDVATRRQDLAFPAEEYAARLRSVTKAMTAAGLDTIIVTSPENVCYLSGFESVGYFNPQALIVTANGDTVLITRALEIPNARASCALENVVGLLDHQSLQHVLVAQVAGLGVSQGRIGLDMQSRWLGSALHNAIVCALPIASFIDAFGIIENARLIKSPLELAAIRAAGQVAANAMRICLGLIAAGRSERDVAADIYRTQIASGSDWTGMPFFIASGPRSGRAHVTWSDRTLTHGDPVFLETNAAHRRYHAAYMRSAYIGPATDSYRSLHAASLAGLDAALSKIRPGVPASEVDHACRAAIEARGWADSFRLRSGYSVGIGFENFGEPLLFSLHRNNHAPLQAGMVLHIVPYLSDARHGGAAVSETVIVTSNGAELLAPLGRDLVERH